ncbi:MAG: NAD-dependent succinate-semialdehyde dehydrogenase [Desulfobacterales bacterium]|nr:NAD-dependent succinate-semialdehyde dehydrogenase [Desulfobacterales bacterium]
MYINGQWIEAKDKKKFSVLNPANGKVIAQVPDGGEAEAIMAVAAADKAFPIWSSRTAYKRSSFLYDAHRLMMEDLESLAQIMTEEQGKPIQSARNEVRYGADFLLWFAEEVKRIYGRTISSSRSDQRFIVIKQPVGVVAAITPWNYPMSMITRKVAPALAAGCTIVLKPAEATPICAMEIFKLLEKAGLPKGVANLVTALDPEPVGRVFTTDKRIQKLTFTGSTDIGKMLAREAAGQMKRISLELGGHAPFIVCKDADPIRAAKGLSLVKFLNTGQACISPNRIYVHSTMKESFLKMLKEKVDLMIPGNGMTPGVKIGPLVNEAEIEKVNSQVKDAVNHGATLVTGGFRIIDNELDKGYFYAPTILDNVTKEMRIYREETFGPVAPVITYEDEDDLLKMANDTDYGLAAYVYTKSYSTAMKFFEGLNFGIIGINDINPTSAAAPFGGMKMSGIGREGAFEGIEEYLETKSGGFSLNT